MKKKLSELSELRCTRLLQLADPGCHTQHEGQLKSRIPVHRNPELTRNGEGYKPMAPIDTIVQPVASR